MRQQMKSQALHMRLLSNSKLDFVRREKGSSERPSN